MRLGIVCKVTRTDNAEGRWPKRKRVKRQNLRVRLGGANTGEAAVDTSTPRPFGKSRTAVFRLRAGRDADGNLPVATWSRHSRAYPGKSALRTELRNHAHRQWQLTALVACSCSSHFCRRWNVASNAADALRARARWRAGRCLLQCVRHSRLRARPALAHAVVFSVVYPLDTYDTALPRPNDLLMYAYLTEQRRVYRRRRPSQGANSRLCSRYCSRFSARRASGATSKASLRPC